MIADGSNHARRPLRLRAGVEQLLSELPLQARGAAGCRPGLSCSCWASLPAFTTEAGKLGVPVLGTGAEFQTGVAGMTVASNVAGILTGTNLAGNLEFWPRDALATRPVSLPGANDTLFDFGDTPTAGNYGSMQLHNSTAGQTLFAFNNWGGNPGAGDVDLASGA